MGRVWLQGDAELEGYVLDVRAASELDISRTKKLQRERGT